MSRIWILLLIIAGMALPVSAQSAEDLFQQALRVERLSGNAEAAIALYEQIIEEHADQRELTARALLQLGKAYEALGREEARRAYSRLVTDFSDYGDLATEARRGLSRTAVPPDAPVDRILELTQPDGTDAWGASLSPDGRYLIAPYWGDEKRGVLMQDVHTGSVTVLEMEKGASEGGAEFASMSPDGAHIAAGWYPSGRSRLGSIRVVDVATGQARVLIDTMDYWRERHGRTLLNANAQAIEWTPDGRSILAFLSSTTEPPEGSEVPGWYEELALIHLDGRPPTIVAETEKAGIYSWNSACISDDARYVFAQYQKLNGPSHDTIVRFDVTDGSFEVWRDHPVYKMSLVGCTSDPDRVIYTEERLGTRALMSAPASSPPNTDASFHREVPANTDFGLASRAGDVVYWAGLPAPTLWSASVNPETVEFSSQPMKQTGAWANTGLWNPVKNEIVWADFQERQIILWNAETNDKKVLPVPASPSQNAFWPSAFSPDGTILGMGRSPAGSPFHYYDVASRTVIDSTEAEVFSEMGVTITRGITPSGKIFGWHEASNCLVRMDLTARTTRPIACFDAGERPHVANFFPSPDHSRAVIEWGRQRENVTRVMLEVVDLDTGASTVILDVEGEEHRLFDYGWSSWVGTTDILYVQRKRNAYNESEAIHLYNLETGTSRRVLNGLVDNIAIRTVRLSTDKRHVVAFGAPKGASSNEMRATVVRNVLSE